MNMRKPFLVSGVIAALALPVIVLAAEPPRCNELFDDAQRLACYDVIFGKPVRPTAKATTPAAPAVAPAAVAAPVAAAPVPAAPAQTSAPKAAKPTAYNSTVTALGKAPDGRFVATLDNGEQWLQLEKSSREEIKVGDTVTMKPMTLGSWAIVPPSGFSQRVKRLK